MIRYAVLCLLSLSLGGCFVTTGTDLKLKTHEVREKYQRGDQTPLRDGHIVMSADTDPMAMIYILGSAEFSRYVHVGVVSIEDGEPYVYEAFGTGIPWPGQVPTDAIDGAIYRSRFQDFLWRQRTVEVYAPPSFVDGKRVAAYARSAFNNKMPFDPYFNAVAHDKVYCTEFIGLALEAGGNPPARLVPRNTNASLTVAIRWLKLDNAMTLPAESLLQDTEPVAVFSLDLTLTEIMIWHEVRRELFNRFTPDQRLGYLFNWHGGKLDFRDGVQTFIDRALALKSSLPAEAAENDVRLAVARLARALFDGPDRNQKRRDISAFSGITR